MELSVVPDRGPLKVSPPPVVGVASPAVGKGYRPSNVAKL